MVPPSTPWLAFARRPPGLDSGPIQTLPRQVKLLTLKAVKQQEIGSYADICNKKRDPILPVPYWSWFQPVTDVAASAERETIKYARTLLKDMLEFCQCVISSAAIEICTAHPSASACSAYFFVLVPQLLDYALPACSLRHW